MIQGATVKGGDVVVKNITVFTKRFLSELNKDMTQVSLALYQQMKKNISQTDVHEGHPYAVRDPRNPHTPGYLVHTISGRMLKALTYGVKRAFVSPEGVLQSSAFAGLNAPGSNDVVPYAEAIVYGTHKMIPRNFLMGSLLEVREELRELLRRSLNQATISFNGERTKL